MYQLLETTRGGGPAPPPPPGSAVVRGFGLGPVERYPEVLALRHHAAVVARFPAHQELLLGISGQP